MRGGRVWERKEEGRREEFIRGGRNFACSTMYWRIEYDPHICMYVCMFMHTYIG